MALDSSLLESGLIRNFSKITISGFEDAQEFMDAYDDYAKTAMDASGGAVSVTGKEAAVGALGKVLSNNMNSVYDVALGLGEAVMTYWTGAVFAGGLPIPPMVTLASEVCTTPPVADILAAGLREVFSDNESDSSVQAGKVAKKLDEATKTTVVTCTGVGPPPGSLPVVVVAPIS